MFDVWATGIFTIAGTLLGTFSGYLLTIHMEKSKQKRDFIILRRRMNKDIYNIAFHANVFQNFLKEHPKLTEKADFKELHASIKISNFFPSVYEFGKLSNQILYYKNETKSLDEAIRNLNVYVRSLELLLEAEKNIPRSNYQSDLKPDLEFAIKEMYKSLGRVQEELEKLY